MQHNDVFPSELVPFLHPKGVAVIGASENPAKLGYGVIRNLLHPEWGFPGPVYPVNPRRDTILGRRAYPHIEDVPDPVDLAVILVPAPAVPEVVAACGRRGVRGVIVVSGGFRELGEEGERLQRTVVEIAHRYGMRLMGPNGIGVIDTVVPLNTTFIRSMPLPGPIAVISQSGALCGAAVDWARARGVGFSRMYSVGNQADLVETDFLRVLAADEHTRVICLYVEEISDGRAFYEAAREVARRKPVLFLKAGRTQAGHEAAKSHTGALAGAVRAYQAACEDAGVHWCTSLQEMLEAAQALAHNPLPAGRATAVITNAGGPAALAADALAEEGLTLARPGEATQTRLRNVLPPVAQVASVVDMLGAAGPDEYAAATGAVLADTGVDMALVLHVPQATVDPLALIDAVDGSRTGDKPVVLSFPGEETVARARYEANRRGVPTVGFPEDAARALRHLWARAAFLSRPSAAPCRPEDLPSQVSFPKAPLLTDWDLRPLLAAYGIPVPQAARATSPEDAARVASEVGYPVALKLLSADILHKSEVGGVVLGLTSPEEVEAAARAMLDRVGRERVQGWEVQAMVPSGVEVIVGLVRDAQFGPLVMVGAGGVLVEVLHDVAFGLAPLDEARARHLVEKTRVARLLEGARGHPPADVDALVDTLVRLSWLAVDWETLQELDINPLFVLPRGQGVVAVDARGRQEGKARPATEGTGRRDSQ